MSAEYVVVCLHTHSLSDDFVQGLKKCFVDFSVHTTRSTKEESAHNYFINIEQGHLEAFNIALIDISRIYLVDIGLIPLATFQSPKGLVVFDMDSTLITSEVIDEMAMKHNVGDKVKLITARAMNGELDFNQSLTERVSFLKGFHRDHMETILASLKFTPGVPECIEKLQAKGIKTAIASGGFAYFANSLKTKLGMDYVFANDLEFDGDLLTGRVLGQIINAEAKEQIIIDLAKKENLTLDQVVAIGDGANDIPMLLKAGLGIAIHAKEKVQRTAKYRITHGPMTHALRYMNYEAL